MIPTRSSLFSFFLCPYAAFNTYAAPSTPGPVQRDAISESSSLDKTEEPLASYSSNSSINAIPTLNASALIRTRNGVDITSSFQVKVYNQAPKPQITNLTEDNDLNDRGMAASEVVRLIMECYGNETFIESHCTPNDDEDAVLGAYVYTCRKIVDHWRATTGEYLGQIPAYQTRSGRCEPNEICVDGFGDKQIASCVHSSLFDDYTIDKDGMIKGMLQGEVFDVAKAWAAVTDKAQTKTLSSKRLGIGAWNSASMNGRGRVKRKGCRECVELETDVLPPDVDSLRVESTLMSTGAIAGILWLALGSG